MWENYPRQSTLIILWVFFPHHTVLSRIKQGPANREMPQSDRPHPLPPTVLLSATRRLMRPLVRLMMLSGVTFPLLAEAIRQLFVEIAAEDVLTNPKTRTDSCISLLTGVHRKEIRRLRQMPPADNATPGGVTLVSQIVTRWTGTARFVDPDGRPRILPRSSNEKLDSNPSFDELVESVTTDVRPRAVLDEPADPGRAGRGRFAQALPPPARERG